MNGLLQPWFHREGLALLTDLYEVTMMGGYFREGMANRKAYFEYFFRSLPPESGFAVFAGLDPFLDYLENLRFDEDDLEYLRSQEIFDSGFLSYLEGFRPGFTVKAAREGSLVFPNEPIVQIEGCLIEVQLIETALLNMLNYQTLIATKAARICLAAEGDPVLEFGLRRAHGPDGGLSGSRAAYIGGCASTSNLLAGKVYQIPVAGTHAHSWVMSFPTDLEAFRSYANSYPERCILLVDTYDTMGSGVPDAITVFKRMRDEGLDFRPGIRLDSGDLAKLSKRAHKRFLEAGFEDPLIVASGDLEEYLIADLKRQGAKINAWGVGTQLITSWDSPSLGGVYKLMAIQENGEWSPRIKVSSNIAKTTDPGRKKAIRYFGDGGTPLGDVLFAPEEYAPSSGTISARSRTSTNLEVELEEAVEARPLLETVFEGGTLREETAPVEQIREYALSQIESLPEEYKRLRNPEIYRVALSEELAGLKDRMLKNPVPSHAL